MTNIDSIIDKYVTKTKQGISIAHIKKKLDSEIEDKKQKNVILYLVQKKALENHNFEQENKIKLKKAKVFLMLLLIALPVVYLFSQIAIPERYMIYANSKVIIWIAMIIGTILTALFTALARR